MDAELDAKAVLLGLKRLEGTVGKKIVRRGVRAGIKPMFAKAKDNASRLEREGTGMAEYIAASLLLKTTPKRTLHARDAHAMEIDFDTQNYPDLIENSPGSGRRNFIPHAIEYGHAGPYAGGSGDKLVAPKEFMRAAYEATKGNSIDVARRLIAKEIKREWNRNK